MKSFTKMIAVGAITLVPLTACEPGHENELTGAVLGATLGGLAGAHVGDGSGRAMAIAFGAMTGMLVGATIGQRLDNQSALLAEKAQRQALNNNRVGESITWNNPDNSGGAARGTIILQRDGADQDGRTCREYSHEVTIAGDTETVIGKACLGDDGRWTEISDG